MAKKEKETEFKRDLIMESAWIVFMDKGFASATMNDIAGKSEYALGTIYKLFKNKEEIFLCLIKKKLTELHDISKYLDDSSKNPEERIRKILNGVADFFSKNKRMLQIFFFEHWTDEFNITKRLHLECQDQFKEFGDTFERIIEEGINGGYFRNVNPFKARIAIKALIMEFFWGEMLNDNSERMDTVIDDVMSFFLYGISNQPQVPNQKNN